MYYSYEEEEARFNEIYSNDHITEAYGPTAADANLMGLEDMRIEAIEAGDKAFQAEVEREIASLKARWGI